MLVFVHINKTAGTTLRYILRSTFGWRHCDVEPWHAAWRDPPFSADDLRRVRRIYPDLASIAGHRISGHVDLGKAESAFTYFTFFRDPIKTTASRFQFQVDYRKKQKLGFEEWIQREWVRNAQTQRIAGVADAGEAIRVIEQKQMFVGLAERFDESMVMLKALRANELDISYRRVNVAKRNTLAAELLGDERTRALIADANDQDLELYRYAVDQLYPAQQRDYGDALAAAVAEYGQRPGQSFNRRNLAMFQTKQRGVYKPLVALYRRSATRPIVERLINTEA